MSQYDTNYIYILRVFRNGATVIECETKLDSAIEKVKDLNEKNTNNEIAYCYLNDNEIY